MVNFSDSRQRALFFEVHSELPREGPGSQLATTRAFRATELAGEINILDIACGPGMQTIDLAELAPDAVITAIDLHPGNVAEAQKRVDEQGLQAQIRVAREDMHSLPFEREAFDLVWCEGAAYIMGVARALAEWRSLLKPRGYLAFTENVWLTTDVPEEIKNWWNTAYPQMGDINECARLCEASGFEVVEHFVLPPSAWWDDYYEPMQARLSRLQQKYLNDDVAKAVLSECQEEIDNYQRFSEFYSYAFFVLKAL